MFVYLSKYPEHTAALQLCPSVHSFSDCSFQCARIQCSGKLGLTPISDSLLKQFVLISEHCVLSETTGLKAAGDKAPLDPSIQVTTLSTSQYLSNKM